MGLNTRCPQRPQPSRDPRPGLREHRPELDPLARSAVRSDAVPMWVLRARGESRRCIQKNEVRRALAC
jgi:hypothetical protein